MSLLETMKKLFIYHQLWRKTRSPLAPLWWSIYRPKLSYNYGNWKK